MILPKKKPNDDPFCPDLSLFNKICASEKYDDSENESLLLRALHGKSPPVINKSMNISLFDPLLSDHMSEFNEFFLPSDTPSDSQTILK